MRILDHSRASIKRFVRHDYTWGSLLGNDRDSVAPTQNLGEGTLENRVIGHDSSLSLWRLPETSVNRAPSREQLLNDLLSLMACHAAVRTGDRLTLEEITALLAQRQLAQDSHHCPHGRPTPLRFTRHDLGRHFKRT
jgi:hypothetical protein